jgi:hypothetical protein
MNNNLEILAILTELKNKSISYNFIAGEEIELEYKILNGVMDILDKYSIKQSEVSKNSIRINLRQFSFPIFYDNNNFLSQVSIENSSNDFGILNYKDSDYLFYEGEGKKTYDVNGVVENYFISNTFAYLRIKKIISSEKIADYVSEAHREIIIISVTKGKLIIGYPITNDNLDIAEDIAFFEKELLDKLNAKEYSKFLKNELFDFLYSVEKDERLKYLVLNLSTILEAANRNYEIYLSNFSFDQIKSEYDYRKQKYFDELRSIVNKLSGYSIGLPISISAASFAAFRTIDSLPTYVLIILAFFIYSIYFIFMIRHNKDDIETLKSDFEFDFESLFKKDFFKRNEKEKKSFLILQKLLNNRITNLILKVHILFSILIILNTSLLIIFLIQINIKILTIIIITIIILSLFFYLYLYNSKQKNENE